MTTAYRPRTRGGPDLRGNTRDRRRRREWLVVTFRADVDMTRRLHMIDSPHRWPVEFGTGEPACRCYRCGHLLTVDTVTADRIIPGCHGGRYVRGNIRPACAGCNSTTGGALRSDRHDSEETRPW